MPKCKICGSPWHYKTFCPRAKTQRIKQGKRSNKWLKFRKQWLQDNPPNHQGYYDCHICLLPVHVSEVTLDHVIARSSDPSLVYVAENIKPAHMVCNINKGSKKLNKVVDNDITLIHNKRRKLEGE